MSKTIEQKYQELSEIEHCLKRPGMWIGSTNVEEKDMFVYNSETELMEMKHVFFVPGMLKVVDEVISNSCDEFRRKDNMGLTTLEVSISKSKGSITIKDNGGIPIVKHKEAQVYIPEFIFGRLRTSSNYDDNENRNVIGINGVGSSISNIFSKKFEVRSADGKHEFHRSWSNNMQTLNDDLTVIKCSKATHYTETTMTLDLKRFNVTEISDDFISIIRKRCIDAAVANIGLEVKFWTDCENFPTYKNKDCWNFSSYDQYIDLYANYLNLEDKIFYKNDLCTAYIFPDSIVDIGFVNGAECSKGTHMRAIRNDINAVLLEYIQKKFKFKDLTTRGIDGRYSVFMDITISNPMYDSQTKECLVTQQDMFSKDDTKKWQSSSKFLNEICKSEIVELVKDWYNKKQEAENVKALRKLNKNAKKLFRSDKFIDCNSRKKEEKQLWLFEGDSAKSGFRLARDPQTQAGYIMRGVPKNSEGLSAVQIMKNEVFADIVNILGLQWGEYNDASKLAYNKIVICSDMDYDGSKIASLLLVFFNHFPELFEQKLICRSISPIIVAKKGNDEKKYISLDEYKKDEKSLKGWKILWNKGLGGLSAIAYKDMLRNPIFHYFKKDELAESSLRKWFAKGIAEERKEMLKDKV